MYRLSEELAQEVLKRIKPPEIVTSGENAFTLKSRKGLGILDPHIGFATDLDYILECPIPVIFPDMEFVPVLKGWFLYKRDELPVVIEQWPVLRIMVDPTATDYEEQIDCGDCSVLLASDIDKLTCLTISTMQSLLQIYPMLIDCLTL